MSRPFSFCPWCATPLADRDDEEGISRLSCPAEDCGFVHYDNPTPVVAAIVQHGDDVVLAQNHGWPETWFGLVTGFLERGETPEDGIIREIAEELCVDATLQSFVGLYTFEMMNQLIIAYHVTIDDEPSAGPELAAIKKVPIDKVRPWPMGTGDALRDWLAARSSE